MVDGVASETPVMVDSGSVITSPSKLPGVVGKVHPLGKVTVMLVPVMITLMPPEARLNVVPPGATDALPPEFSTVPWPG
jgi:hypothetical protein